MRAILFYGALVWLAVVGGKPVVAADDALPDAESIRATARQIVARPEFQPAPTSSSTRLIEHVLEWLLEHVLKPLFNLFRSLYDISPILGVAYVVALVAILVGLLTHMFLSIKRIAQGARAARTYTVATPVDNPDELERASDLAYARQDYMTAVRLLFRACLLRLAQAEKRAVRKGATNREQLRHFQNSLAHNPLKQFVEVIDLKWYGQGVCGPAEYDECRRAHAEILQRAI